MVFVFVAVTDVLMYEVNTMNKQQFLKLFNKVRHIGTKFNNIKHYSTLFKKIRQNSTKFGIDM